MCDIIKLQAALLSTANCYLDELDMVRRDVLVKPTEAICELLNPTECSLWSINRNTTMNQANGNEKKERTTSVIFRKVNPEYDNFTVEADFAHELQTGLFSKVTEKEGRETIDNGFFRCDKDEVRKYKHQSFKLVEERELNDFIVIPIADIKGRIVAVMNFSYNKKTIDDEKWKEIAPIISRFYSAAFNRYLIYQKQNLVEKLIKTHDEYKNKDIESYFNHLITDKNGFKNYFDYQGASVFIWDSFYNKYSLMTITTIEEGIGTEKAFYTKGKGHTGRVGSSGEACVIDSILPDCKRFEKTDIPAKTAMIIPIASPSNPKKVIGIIRFVNKKNACNPSFVDFFNDVDLKLMEFASKYLSLAVDFFLKEKDQSNTISKLAHEFKTPANAIFKSAERLLEYKDDINFLKRYLSPYLENISDFAQLQQWQAELTLYLTGHHKRQYNRKKCSLFEVLKKSRDVARPIAREYDVKFGNIVIMPFDSKLCLNIDEKAFVIVFHNLLTNAIKYHNNQDPDSFFVSISCYENIGTVRILIEDHGVGIDIDERDSIFHVGYRGTAAIKENLSGFGVGLPTVKQIVEDFGGKVSVTSCMNPTTFEISLPISLKI